MIVSPPSHGTPCTVSFQPSSWVIEAIAASGIGAAVKVPRTATPVDCEL